MATQTSILNLITDAIEDRLTEKLITDLDDNPDPDEEAQAGVVLQGKLLDDPTITSINIIIRGGDDKWPHTLNVADQTTAVRELAYEIGGGAFNKRRFIIYLKLFFEGEFEPAVAREKANIVLSRVENAIWSQNIRAIPRDSFGEKIWRHEVNDSWIRDGGGPGIYIYRGQVFVTYFTNVDVREVSA